MLLDSEGGTMIDEISRYLNSFWHVVHPILFVIGGYIAGVIIDKIVLTKLHGLTKRTSWAIDDVIIGALKGVSVFWCVMVGVYCAILQIPLKPELLNLIEKGVLVILLFSATFTGAKIAGGLVQVYSKKYEGIIPATSIFTNISKFIVFVLGCLVILQSIGIQITPILTALGVGGLAVALALQDTLSNLFAGFHILASKQIRPGDYVRLDSGQEGYVADITWRNTSIRALSNDMIVVPNSKLSTSIVTNFHLPEETVAVVVPVGVSYDSDLEKVEKVAVDVAKNVMNTSQGGVPSFEPAVRYQAFADSSINFNVVMRAREFKDQAIIKHDFIKQLYLRFKAEGIEIPFPIRTVHLKQDK